MRATLDAFRATIKAQGVTVYAAGEVPNSPTYPYVVTFASTPTPSDRSQAAKSGSMRWRVATLMAAASEGSAFWVAEKLEAALLDQRLTVAGKSCSPISRESGAPIRPDRDAENVLTGTDVWTFVTTNA